MGPTLRILSLFALALAPCIARADTTTYPGVGDHFDSLTVGLETYHHLTVRQVTARSITVLADEGMASIPLHELSPELQAHFGYSREAEKAADVKIEQNRRTPEASAARRPRTGEIDRSDEIGAKFDGLLQHFGQSPELKPEIDLRPRLFELSLGAKDQGRRPSCAIFAVTSALEFQNAELTGVPEKLSEEYLTWAVRRTVQRSDIPATAEASFAGASAEEKFETFDDGFSLGEVIAALRAYGIPPQSAMPNKLGGKISNIADPAPEIVERARNHRKVSVYSIPGRDALSRLSNIIHALNAGIPVTIGLRWPNSHTIRSGYLSEQKPILNYMHAVTLVGYKCENGELEKTVFVFRNSYGPTWGQNGFGQITIGYLKQYLLDAVLLEVQKGER